MKNLKIMFSIFMVIIFIFTSVIPTFALDKNNV